MKSGRFYEVVAVVAGSFLVGGHIGNAIADNRLATAVGCFVGSVIGLMVFISSLRKHG